MNRNELRYLQHAEIDFQKWDQCIDRAPNSRVYASSWYLNRTAGFWSALVWGDYHYVMPLLARKKFGISYVYQPFFTQQLGIFPVAPPELQALFAQKLVSLFRYVVYQSGNSLAETAFDGFLLSRKRNRALPLIGNYPILNDGFSENTRRNIRKAQRAQLSVSCGMAPEEFLRMKKQSLAEPVPPDSFRLLRTLLTDSLAGGIGKIYVARTSSGELVSAAFFLGWQNRVYYLNAFSTSEGKLLKAAFLIVDQFIRDHAASGLILDFEGSEVGGVDRFYSGFGAGSETYLLLRLNRLPWFLRLFKK